MHFQLFKVYFRFQLVLLCINAYTFIGNLITDLEYNDTAFIDELTNWTIITASSQIYSTCNFTTLLGGYNALRPNDLMIRIYTDLPPHNIVDLGFEAWRIDSLDAADKFIYYVDGSKYTFTGTSFAGTKNWCGGVWADDMIFYYYTKIFHNASTLNLTFQNGFNQMPNDESFGYRGIKIRFRNKSSSEYELVYGYGSTAPKNIKLLTCGAGQAVSNPFYGCSNCVKGCSWCDGNNIQNCSFCDSSSQDYSWCQTCVKSIGNQCYQCTKPYYLNIYNRTCDISCEFVNITNSSGLYCYFPCNSSQFLQEDGTCTSSCNDTKYINEYYPGVRKCNFKCPQDTYMYLNGTCTSNCKFPYIEVQTPTARYCQFVCSNQTFLSDNSCAKNCKKSQNLMILSYNNETYCIDKSKNAFLGGLITAVQTVVTATFASSAPLILVGVDPSIVASLVAMLQMFFYLLFFNVNYPDNVRDFLALFSIGRFDFLPNPLTWVEFDFDPLDSPQNFNENGYTGLMFQSAGPILFGYAILLGIDIVTLAIARHFNFLKLIRRLSIMVSQNIKVNGYIRLILATFPDMMFTSLLQIIQLNFSTYLYSASSGIAIIVLFTNFVFLSMSFRLLSRTSSDHKSFEIFEAFFEDYDIAKPHVKFFGYLRLLFKTGYCIALVLFYYMPYYQVGIPLFLNIFMTTFLMKLEPHHHEKKNIQEIILEISYLCLHSCILALAIDDDNLGLSFTTRENVGWCMIGIIVLNVLISTIGIIIEEYHAITHFIRDLRTSRTKIFEKKRKQKITTHYSTQTTLMTTENKLESPEKKKVIEKTRFRKVNFVINPLRASMPIQIPRNSILLHLEDDSQGSGSSDEEELTLYPIKMPLPRKPLTQQTQNRPIKTPRKLSG